MEITDVRIRLANDSTDRLKAYCSITLEDDFVIRDLKIVDGVSGLFVAMPSRKSTIGCPRCHHKSPVRSRFCNECGANMPPAPLQPTDGPRAKSHRDIAHPITAEYREYVQDRVLAAYRAECRLASQPDYEPQTLDEDEEEVVDAAPPPPPPPPRRPRGGRGRPVEQVPQVVAEEPDADPIDNYDALIAGLKGGPGRGRGPAPENRSVGAAPPRPPQPPQRGRAGSPPPQPQRPRAQEPQMPQQSRQGPGGQDDHRGRGDGRHQGGRDRGGRGDQRGGDRSNDRGRFQRGGQRGDGGHAQQGRETITNVASAPVSHVAEPQRIEPVRMEAPRPVPVAARVAPPPPPPPPVVDVDDTPFGEGIL